MRKIIITLLVLAFFSFGLTVLAEETETTIEEEISAQDLGVSDPSLLPDSPFYFFKTLGRTIQSAFTFNAVKKAELREKFANEALVEMQKMVDMEKENDSIEKGIQNYQKELQAAKQTAEKIKEKAEENEQVGLFLDKFIQQQTIHQRVLQNIEENVPDEVFEKISQVRAEHLEKFGEVMTKLENNSEQVRERLEKNIQEVKGSEFQDFKNIEMLKELEEKVPEEAREAIKEAAQNTFDRLKTVIENIAPEATEKFEVYTETMSGNKERQMEIINDLKEAVNNQNTINLLEKAKVEIMERVRTETTERIRIEEGEPLQEATQGMNREEEKVQLQTQMQLMQEINLDAAGNILEEKILNPIKDILPGQIMNTSGQNGATNAKQQQMQQTGQITPQQ